MIEQQAQKFLEAFQAKLPVAREKKLVFLLIGRTGVGKSSTVNALMGKQIAEVGDYEATTMGVESYESELDGIKFQVIDTPGLCDDIEEAERDQQYLDLMRSKITQIDSMWFVSPLNDTRVRSDEIQAIELISKAFGSKVWEHAIIIFTFANSVSAVKYPEALKKRTELIRKAIAKCEDVGLVVANEIPSLAVDTGSEITPDGEKWLGELFTKVFSRISERGTIPFFLAMADSLKSPQSGKKKSELDSTPYASAQASPQKPRIELTQEQKKEVKKRIDASIIPGLAIAGSGIGSVFGPAGAAIGGGIGAAIGLIAWLWD
ncbi:GTPase [Cylindrospermum sp. FACHB-282]|uniref:GTPase n=1 Tax=Cylindrospermum sp. FACHB-282 TaxID=2692794 RepID=UPI0016874FE5|nr:GTPase [Cylindrospermum sp. FACHB-282]MBD2385136.1 50S ribosome-binding GTPase [Cylindrospermum sp. FACHB-282]